MGMKVPGPDTPHKRFRVYWEGDPGTVLGSFDTLDEAKEGAAGQIPGLTSGSHGDCAGCVNQAAASGALLTSMPSLPAAASTDPPTPRLLEPTPNSTPLRRTP